MRHGRYKSDWTLEEIRESCDIDGGCWLWRKAKVRGYGVLRVRGMGRQRKVSHVAWELANNEAWPHGKFALHSCHTPACANPGHIRPGSHVDNMTDMMAASRSARGERHSQAKVESEDDVREMRRRREAGETYASIAKDFPVGKQAVRDICIRRRWGHVD